MKDSLGSLVSLCLTIVSFSPPIEFADSARFLATSIRGSHRLSSVVLLQAFSFVKTFLCSICALSSSPCCISQSATMATNQEPNFEGWMGLDKNSAQGNMVWQKFPNPKKFEETDVDIQISHCGICGSDIHTLRSGWGPTLYR